MTDPTGHLTEFLALLDRRDADQHLDLFVQEVISSGGTYLVPGTHNFPASHLVELSLYGVTATGYSEAEALANWSKCAGRQTQQVAA